MPITTPPTRPDPADSRATFNSRAFAFFDWFETLVSNINTYFRERLAAATTYYVSPTGSDSAAGSQVAPFLTIQKAIDVAAGLDNNGFDVTINVAAGTYTAANTLKSIIGAGRIYIRGGTADMTSTVISTTSAACFDPGAYGFDGVYSLEYMKLQTTTAGDCIGSGSFGGAGTITWQNVAFGACAGMHVKAGQGQNRYATGAYTINGGATYHWGSWDGGQIRAAAAVVTLTGTPAITVFASADRGGNILCVGTTYSGSATGTRYSASLNGVIQTGGATLPGSVAGSTATGGQYA